MPRAADALQQRLRVLYDPVGYLPGWRAVAATLTGEQRSALNAIVIRLHALPSYDVPAPGALQWTQRLVRAWDAIPVAAFLLACTAWGEDRLAALPLFRKFEPQVHAFLQLRFPVFAALESDVPTTRAALAGWGGACLLAALPGVPPWLHARIAVRFPALPAVCRLPMAHAGDLSCFSMALAHAQKDPGFRRSFLP